MHLLYPAPALGDKGVPGLGRTEPNRAHRGRVRRGSCTPCPSSGPRGQAHPPAPPASTRRGPAASTHRICGPPMRTYLRPDLPTRAGASSDATPPAGVSAAAQPRAQPPPPRPPARTRLGATRGRTYLQAPGLRGWSAWGRGGGLRAPRRELLPGIWRREGGWSGRGLSLGSVGAGVRLPGLPFAFQRPGLGARGCAPAVPGAEAGRGVGAGRETPPPPPSFRLGGGAPTAPRPDSPRAPLSASFPAHPGIRERARARIGAAPR